MKMLRILILEDDLRALAHMVRALSLFEEELYAENAGFDISLTILSEYTQVEDYVNKQDSTAFDIILLDRDCKICGSFHCLDIEKFGGEKVISISAIPEWNRQARERGVESVILKTHEDIEDFTQKVIDEIRRRVKEI